MALAQKITNFLKKKYNSFLIIGPRAIQVKNFNPVLLITLMIIFFGIFFFSNNFINKKNKKNTNNLKEIIETNEFSNLTNFFISK